MNLANFWGLLFIATVAVSVPSESDAITGFESFEALKPSARMRLRWRENIENSNEVSGPEILLQAGIFPTVNAWFSFGVQLSTGETTLGESPDSIQLKDGMSLKSIGLSQAYVKLTHGTSTQMTVQMGKFASTILSNPFLFDPLLSAEGFYEEIGIFQNSTRFKIKAFASQRSIDQVGYNSTSASQPMRRSWIFVQGAELFYSWTTDVQFRFSGQIHFDHDMSEAIVDLSAKRGNSILGTVGNSPRFQNRYAPIEVFADLSGRPIGIYSAVRGGLAINPRAHDKDRGFFIQGSLGSPWMKDELHTSIAYYYAEPDLGVAAISSSDYGYLNRKGFRVTSTYYLEEFLGVGGSFLFVETLAGSSFQDTRKEFKIDLEARF